MVVLDGPFKLAGSHPDRPRNPPDLFRNAGAPADPPMAVAGGPLDSRLASSADPERQRRLLRFRGDRDVVETVVLAVVVDMVPLPQGSHHVEHFIGSRTAIATAEAHRRP